LNRLRWTAIKAYERLGWPGLLGLSTLLVTAMFYAVAIRPLYRNLQSIESRGSEDRQRQLDRLNARLAEENKPAREYAAFLDYFATKEMLPDRLTTIFNAAKRAGLTLGQADYQLNDAGNLPLREFRVTLPVSGNYTVIRRFVAAILVAIPSAALEQIRFQRRKIGDPAVEAEIRFTIYSPATP